MRYEIKTILITENDVAFVRRSYFRCDEKPISARAYEYRKISPASRSRIELRTVGYPKFLRLKDNGISVIVTVRK